MSEFSRPGRTLPEESLELQRELQQLPLPDPELLLLLLLLDLDEDRLLILLTELSLSLSTLSSSPPPPPFMRPNSAFSSAITREIVHQLVDKWNSSSLTVILCCQSAHSLL